MSASGSGLEPEQKKKRPKSNVVFSQPADTGTGSNVNTQLVYAVKHLKDNGNPMRLQDLAILSNLPLMSDQHLLERFKGHDRVLHDEKTGLFSYRHDFNLKNKATLLTEIQRHARNGGGLSVRQLKESWKEAPAAIDELEKEGEVLVTRTLKDGQMKMVFWNEVRAPEPPVEDEFRSMWHSLVVPPEADMLRVLRAEGLQATQGESAVARGPAPKKKGKKSGPRQRQVRIMNTHLQQEGIDLSKDYVPPPKQ
ncbi:transcription initiation factor IIE, beta subunit [Auricularia subglabra TFB-10046 SS5]|nr:transcription initiation factor IIE, beta subunit [Auricularia subglabra TFB-10046 SS5]